MTNRITTRRALGTSLLALGFMLAGCGAKPDGESAMRTSTETREVDIGGLLHVREEKSVTEPAEAPADNAVEADRPRPQSGNLTAGDHDDLLNPDQYAAYASDALQASGRDLPFVDPRNRLTVRVVDAAGRPVPEAQLTIGRTGAPLRLVTAADGTANVFPTFDRIAASARISATSATGQTARTVAIAGKGRQSVTLTLPGAARPVQALDLMLVLDTTGSMGDEMDYLQAELTDIVARVKRDAGQLDLRIGLILYRDDGDDYVVRRFALTGDVAAIRETLTSQSAGGGGDMPEAVDRALAAADEMPWRPDAAKALLLVADAPPHDGALADTLATTARLRSRGVQFVPVAASGVDAKAEFVMRTMAVMTQGRYLFLTDDSGIGDAHAEPSVDCYVVTRLDQLIARVLAGLVTGTRVEPAPGEIIRTVGDYDHGRCRTGATNAPANANANAN